jgi:hypothetical protein
MSYARFPSTNPRSVVVLAAIAGTLGCSAQHSVGGAGGTHSNETGGRAGGASGGADGSAGAVGAADAGAAGTGGPSGDGAAGGGGGQAGGNVIGDGGSWSASGGAPGNGGGPSASVGTGGGPIASGGNGGAPPVAQGGQVGSGGSAGQAAANGGGVVPPLKAPSFVLVPGSAVGSVLADMNGDGKLDLLGLNPAIVGTAGRVTLMLGHGDGTFGAISTVGPAVNAFAVGDLDGDTIPDLVTTSANSATGGLADGIGRLAVYTNKSDATFSAPVALVADSNTHSVLIADLDGNGRLDIAAGCDRSLLDIFVNNGRGQFAPNASYLDSGPAPGAPTGAFWAYQIAAGDLNGDGATDLAVVIGDIGRLTFLLNKGDGTFTSSVTLATPEFDHSLLSPRSLVLADMNGDGKSDFVAGGFGENGHILLSTGGDVAAATLGALLNGGDVLAVVDVNGDGHRDVVLPGSADGAIYGLFLGGGDGVTGQHVSWGPYSATAVGDVNGDGKPDIVVGGGVLLNTTP